jgi:hypothetical protein
MRNPFTYGAALIAAPLALLALAGLLRLAR